MKKISKLFSLELPGLPPTVNNFYRSAPGGRRYKTEQGREYQEEISALMREAWHDNLPYTGCVSLCIEFTQATHRHWDIDNRVKALQDCLQIAGVIKNDFQIDALFVIRKEGNADRTRIALYEGVKVFYHDGK